MLIYQSEIISAYMEMTWQCEISSPHDYCWSSYIVSYHTLLFKLLLIAMHCNCARTGFEVRACTAPSPHIRKKNLFHKFIRVTREKFSWFSTIHEIFLTSNYFRTAVVHKINTLKSSWLKYFSTG